MLVISNRPRAITPWIVKHLVQLLLLTVVLITGWSVQLCVQSVHGSPRCNSIPVSTSLHSLIRSFRNTQKTRIETLHYPLEACTFGAWKLFTIYDRFVPCYDCHDRWFPLHDQKALLKSLQTDIRSMRLCTSLLVTLNGTTTWNLSPVSCHSVSNCDLIKYFNMIVFHWY